MVVADATRAVPADKVHEMEAFPPGGQLHRRTDIACRKGTAPPTAFTTGKTRLTRWGSDYPTLTLDW